MASELKVGTEPAPNVVTPPKFTIPVKDRVCPINEDVKLETVIFDVVESSSLMMKTSLGVIAVTGGNSLTLILANVLRDNFSSYLSILNKTTYGRL